MDLFLYESWYKLWYILGMEKSLKAVVKDYSNFEIWFIGHSLGGAKAEMAVLSMLLKRMVTQNKVRLLTFGSARVGDMSFVNLIEALVWYPNGMGAGARYFVCLGAEDPQCSSRLSPWEIRAADNDLYFERSMQHWAESFCAESERYVKLHPTRYADMREPVYDMSSVKTSYSTFGTIPMTSPHLIVTNPKFFHMERTYTVPASFTSTSDDRSTSTPMLTTTPVLFRTSTSTTSSTTRIFTSAPISSTPNPITELHMLNGSSTQDTAKLHTRLVVIHFP
ncbi:unnamed protein product [Heligmosomoides polygyrus]|uniref:Lipase_3 domain-containing protein n=1 Tax=Heligmosomoides polygyrus TaxID=6339 RepID=A0A183G7B8_HELPZ|nr:unnamed protein product [Heligmosomoides polygyrus]